MNETRTNRQELFDQLPSEWAEDLMPAIQEQVLSSGRKIVVLDDDPTGTQTVHGVPVLTEWSVQQLVEALRSSVPAIYLLTNSRSLPLDEAQALNTETGARLRQAVQESGVGIAAISRSDSTLRGHFPGEVEALASSLEEDFDAWLVVPFFAEGGRYTIADIHYVAEGEQLIPAGQTEFAQDHTFGFRASNLREWVAEKTGGAIRPESVASISLADVRLGGPQAVTRRLLSLPKGTVVIVNAASNRDLEVLVMGLLAAERQGKRYLYLTAASFVRVRAGITLRPLLTPVELHLPEGSAGLIVAGSYVPRTSAQLEALFAYARIAPVQMQVRRVLSEATRQDEIERCADKVNQYMASSQEVVLYTSRELVSATGSQDNLIMGKTISSSLVAVVHKLNTRPRYLLAKGGITSSDIATQGLGIRKATVLGQILPGVPVWQTGPESRFPGLTYIVFPGNVGSAAALLNIVQDLNRWNPNFLDGTTGNNYAGS